MSGAAGVVVAGTDTGVGKTLVAAALLRAVARADAGRPRRYWKPVQTGFPSDDDTRDVIRFARLAPQEAVAPLARFALPASPFEAARAERRPVPTSYGPLGGPADAFHVVEGAGGLLVPLDATTLQVDALGALGLPFLLVARPDVGTLNHTLLSVEAARARGLDVVAIVVSRPPTAAVAEAMARFTGVPVVSLPTLPAIDPAGLDVAAAVLAAAPAIRALWERGTATSVRPARRLLARDADVVWHPYTQHATAAPPLEIVGARGASLTLADGRTVLDGISSWWTTLHGHGDPRIVRAISTQAARLDHVLFAGTTHEPAVALAERLVALAPRGLARVFYADDGSTAVEAALKAALAFHRRRGHPERDRLVALEGGYHGDTAGAMSVSADGVFVRDFGALRVPVVRTPVPVRSGDVGACVEALRATLDRHADRAAAMIVEPLLQGAAGMLVHPPEFLRAVRTETAARGILLVADEVFTGFGRTGDRFACGHAGVTPDLLVLGKALTGGTLSLAAFLATEQVFRAFLGAGADAALLHGHSYTANPIACAAAVAALDALDDAALARGRALGGRIRAQVAGLAGRPGVRDVRGIGLVTAVETENTAGRGYLAPTGARMAAAALARGVLLRPLGDVVYAIPPLCTTDEEADRIAVALVAAVEAGIL